MRKATCGQGTARSGPTLNALTVACWFRTGDSGMSHSGCELRGALKRQPTEQELRDAPFCWKVAKFVKSNAIVHAKENMTTVAAQPMSRAYLPKSPALKPVMKRPRRKRSAMASDAFFPFRDGTDAAAAVGVSCVLSSPAVLSATKR